jgi:hypothetical protein
MIFTTLSTLLIDYKYAEVGTYPTPVLLQLLREH